MSALIDREDMPPRKRAPLPTKEQIESITDVQALVEIEQEVERRAEKITVDLEMEVGDEDWDARARSALTAHRICLKAVRKQLHKLRTGSNAKPPQIEVDHARLERKVQKAAALATVKSKEAERAQAKAEKVRAAIIGQQLALIRRTSFHMHFYEAARATLTPEQFADLSERARTETIESISLVPLGAASNEPVAAPPPREEDKQ